MTLINDYGVPKLIRLFSKIGQVWTFFVLFEMEECRADKSWAHFYKINVNSKNILTPKSFFKNQVNF